MEIQRFLFAVKRTDGDWQTQGKPFECFSVDLEFQDLFISNSTFYKEKLPCELWLEFRERKYEKKKKQFILNATGLYDMQ